MYKNHEKLGSEEFCVEFPQMRYIILSESCRHCDWRTVKLINAFCGQTLFEC